VVDHRHARPYRRLFTAVAFGQQHRFALILLRQYAPPGVDNRRVAISLPWPRMHPALGGRQQITLGLDGPCANQHIPMGGAGDRGEGRGRGNQFSPRRAQLAVQLREAQVVTHRQAQAADRRIRHHNVAPESIVIGFTIATARVRHVDIEQMQLVVAGDDLAMLIDQQRAGVGLGVRLILGRQRQSASHYP